MTKNIFTEEDYETFEPALSLLIMLMADAGIEAVVTRPDKNSYKRTVMCLIPSVVGKNLPRMKVPAYITQASEDYEKVEIYIPLRAEINGLKKTVAVSPAYAMSKSLAEVERFQDD